MSNFCPFCTCPYISGGNFSGFWFGCLIIPCYIPIVYGFLSPVHLCFRLIQKKGLIIIIILLFLFLLLFSMT